MLRISAGVSLCFTLLAIGGAVGGCSSESTGGGQAGSSSTAGSSSATAGSGGTSSSSGGTGSGGTSSAGTSSGRAGSSGSGTAGTPAGSCTPGEVICVDETTAEACDEDTGEPVTINCVEDLKEIGFDSTGCDAAEGLCNSEPTDPVCWDGATVFAICAQLTSEQYLNVYVNCWENNNDAQPLVRCLAPFLAASGTQADCAGAEVECAQYAGEGGAGPGGGGAPSAGGAGG